MQVTSDEFPHSLKGKIIEIAKIVGSVSIILSAAVGLWAGTVGPVAEFFDRIDILVEDVQTLKEEVARANGEDRVIRQPQGLSYIKEPVRQGETVTMFLVAGRTKLGEDCRLVNWMPIFVDERNIPTPGTRKRAGGVARQIDRDLQTLEIEMTPPDNLRPGRIVVYLTLDYMCPGERQDRSVPDRSDNLAYELLPAA